MPLTADGGQQARVSQLDGDQHVQHGDDRHGQHEEQEGRDLEGVFDQCPSQRAPGAIQDDSAVVVGVDDAELDGLWHGEAEGQQPNRYHELHRPGEFRHCVRDEGMANRHVSLDGEGRDGENGGVRRGLRGEALYNAERLAEYVRKVRPYVIHLRRQAEHEQKKVGHRQAEEVVIGGGVHGLVARDYHARGDIADQAGEEDHDVNHRDRQHDVQGVPAINGALFSKQGAEHVRIILILRICVNDTVDRGTRFLQIAVFQESPGIPILKGPGDVRYRITRKHSAFFVVSQDGIGKTRRQ